MLPVHMKRHAVFFHPAAVVPNDDPDVDYGGLDDAKSKVLCKEVEKEKGSWDDAVSSIIETRRRGGRRRRP